MRVERLTVSAFRNLAEGSLALGDGITLLHGSNGAGKTNLLESLYFGLTGASCRTRNRREAIAFEEDLARVEVTVARDGERASFLAAISRDGSRRHLLDGSPLPPGTGLLRRPALAVFMPDRLGLVKGGPGPRRSHLDHLVAALWPARAETPRRYARALAQRNRLLARIRADSIGRDSLDAWDRELATEGCELIAARREAVEWLSEPFGRSAGELGLAGGAKLAYRPRSEAREPSALESELRAVRETDIARGHSTHGPHLDEVEIGIEGRLARRFASQGEQRIALLALLFAERELIIAERGAAPLMMLDDVMSELDGERRELLTAKVAGEGQTLITATHPAQVPDVAARTEVAVEGGRLLGAAALRKVA